MRENGFFSQGCGNVTVGEVLQYETPTRHHQRCMLTDHVHDVITLMKSNGISQAPVLQDGRLVGIVREVDLLEHMLMVQPQS